MHELDKYQFANCSVHTGLILDSQDSFKSKTIASPSVSEATAPSSVSVSTAPPSLLKTIAPPSNQHQSVNTIASVSKTSNHSWLVKPKREQLSNYFKFHPHQLETTKLNSIARMCIFDLMTLEGVGSGYGCPIAKKKKRFCVMFALHMAVLASNNPTHFLLILVRGNIFTNE